MALALWNGRDPILKERMFGLTGPQGNHGEDVKEYWWYLDALPSHAWLRWRYHYPQAEFPYGDLVAENGRRDHSQPEYELLDTGVFDDDRYWVVEVVHAKADPHDLLMEIRVTNAGPGRGHAARAAAPVVPQHLGVGRPARRARRCGPRDPTGSPSDHPRLGRAGVGGRHRSRRLGARAAVLRERDQRWPRLYGSADSPAFPKDGINDHVVAGAPTVNPDRTGTKCAAWYQLTVAPGETQVVRVRLRPPSSKPAFGKPFDEVLADATPGGRRVLRRGDPGRRQRRRAPRGPPGVRRDDLGQAVLLLRREALAGRRSRPSRRHRRSAATGRNAGVDAHGRPGHPVDARPVGVPVVRRVGPRLPHHRPGPHRPGVRQVPAAGDVPGVVPAPQRGAARLRVGVRRRQPAGARVGGAARVGHRRPARPRRSWPGCCPSCW